jgi:hypothetical protein
MTADLLMKTTIIGQYSPLDFSTVCQFEHSAQIARNRRTRDF